MRHTDHMSQITLVVESEASVNSLSHPQSHSVSVAHLSCRNHLLTMSQSFDFSVTSSPQPKLAYTNRVYISKSNFNALGSAARSMGVQISAADPSVNITVGSCVYLAW